MEPRMRPRPKGPQFPPDDLSAILHAYGDTSPPPLASTITTLDNIITDYIIEICHEASTHATYAGRAKVKQDDFQWALRKDQRKLGRVQELLEKEREMKQKRRIFEPEGEVGGALGEGQDGSEFEGPRKGVGRGRGRRKKKKVEEPAEGKVKDEDAKSEGGKGVVGEDNGDDLFNDED